MIKNIKLPLMVALVAAGGLAVGGCASSSKKSGRADAATTASAKKTESKQESGPFWKKLISKPGFHVPEYDEVRRGPGLLSGKDGEIEVFSMPDRGSADPNKPEKVRR